MDKSQHEIAYDFLDQDDFPNALIAFRKLALMAPPSFDTLSCIVTAENCEILKFWRELREKYPESLDVWLDEAERFIVLGKCDHAVCRCSELLSRSCWSPREELRIRYCRLKAAIRYYEPNQFLKDDFIFVLLFFKHKPYWNQNLKSLCKLLLKIDNPRFVVALKSLKSEMVDYPNISDLIDLKIRQLEILSQIQEG